MKITSAQFDLLLRKCPFKNWAHDSMCYCCGDYRGGAKGPLVTIFVGSDDGFYAVRPFRMHRRCLPLSILCRPEELLDWSPERFKAWLVVNTLAQEGP